MSWLTLQGGEALKEFRSSIACWAEATNKLSNFGNAEKMCSQASGLGLLAEAIHKFNLEGQTTVSLGPYTEELKNRAAEWRRAGLHGQRLFDVFGLASNGLELSNLRRVTAAVRQLTVLPKRLFGLRSDALGEAGAGVLLEEGTEKAKTIRIALEKMEERFTFEAKEDPNALRHHSAVLRSSGLFGFMRGDVRAAKRKYRALLKAPNKISASRIADELDQMADVLMAVRIFNLDTKLRTLCGSQFKGIGTEFGGLIKVHDWMVATVAMVVPPDTTGQQIKRVLLKETAEKLSSILDWLERPEHAILERLLDPSLGSEGTIEHPIEGA